MADNKQQIFKLILDNKQAFRDFGADKIGVFGSFVRDEQRQDSDVDLLIEFLPGQKNYKNLLGVADLAEKLMGREVEVLTSQSISPYIAPYIEREIEYVQTA